MMTPGRGQFRSRGMICRIYVEYHLTLLHTKYTSFMPCGFREEDFKCFPHYKPMADNDAPGAWPMTTGLRLAGIMKGLTKHCFTQNIKALGLMVSEKKIIYVFSYYKSMEANDPRCMANLDPSGMIGRIYEGYH